MQGAMTPGGPAKLGGGETRRTEATEETEVEGVALNTRGSSKARWGMGGMFLPTGQGRRQRPGQVQRARGFATVYRKGADLRPQGLLLLSRVELL